MLGGLYDTWACGCGDMRLIERVELGLNPYLLAQYLLRAPFGSSGWIISINNMEDLIGGHYWVSFYLILGSCWHIQTRALTITTRAFTWSAEASQAQSFTFLIRDCKLGIKITSSEGPTALGKYLMRSPTSVGGVATEINSVNYVSPRSWLKIISLVLSILHLVGHWWHGARARASALSSETGLSRVYEPVLYMRPID